MYVPNGTPTNSYPQTGQAQVLIDYGPEHHLMWVVAMDQGGEIWTLPNTEVRFQANHTMGRTA